MKKESTTKIYVSHGSEWPEHEDFLVGNKEGLKTLIDSINEAIENGESKNDLYEFVGVRCLDTCFFEKNQEKASILNSIMGWSILFFVGCVFLIGIITIIGWF